MAKGIGNRRDDWSWDGFFGFKRTGVTHADDGHDLLRQYVVFDQAGWTKVDVSGQSTYSKLNEGATSRVYEKIIADSVGEHHLYLRFRIPRDFGSFSAGCLTLFTYRSAAVTELLLTLSKAGVADSGINGVDIDPGSNGVWAQKTLAPADSYNPGDFCMLDVKYSSAVIGRSIRVADLALAYLTARGNV
jgi:hypothetical protein